MRIVLFLSVVTFLNCSAQDMNVGGPCEGCEALYEYGDHFLNEVDTLPHFNRTQSPLILSGTVFMPDGETPAPNVIIYAYHTNEEGIYITRDDSEGWERRHGYLRGWVKTGPDGKFKFYTNRPGAYPARNNPEHIHLTVKEPGMTPYYIDAVHFLDDPLLTEAEKSGMKSRGGSGLVAPESIRGTWIITRNILLGKNIPGYPEG